jgi:hypothetical protein
MKLALQPPPHPIAKTKCYGCTVLLPADNRLHISAKMEVKCDIQRPKEKDSSFSFPLRDLETSIYLNLQT